MASKKKNVLLLNPNMPPRAVDILNMLSKEKNIDLQVFFYKLASGNRRWNKNLKKKIYFQHTFLKTLEFNLGSKDFIPLRISFDFPTKLLRLKPEYIIVPGWSDMPSFISMLYCIFTDCKLVLRSESTRYEDSIRRRLFLPLTKLMVNTADSYVASGTRAKEYLVGLGADEDKVVFGYSTINVDTFQKKSRLTSKQKKRLKKKLQIPDDSIVAMFNGQLIERKGVFELIEAFARVARKHKKAHLLMIGYGREKERLIRRAKKKGVYDRIVFTGFVQNEKLPSYYAIADVFILPSREETWGIVVNEAMACGCPVIVGDRVGSSEDIVKDGLNGIIFKSGDVAELSKAIDYLIGHEGDRKQMGKEARRIIQGYKLRNITKALVEALGIPN